MKEARSMVSRLGSSEELLEFIDRTKRKRKRKRCEKLGGLSWKSLGRFCTIYREHG
jgi:hypothetical protein